MIKWVILVYLRRQVAKINLDLQTGFRQKSGSELQRASLFISQMRVPGLISPAQWWSVGWKPNAWIITFDHISAVGCSAGPRTGWWIQLQIQALFMYICLCQLQAELQVQWKENNSEKVPSWATGFHQLNQRVSLVEGENFLIPTSSMGNNRENKQVQLGWSVARNKPKTKLCTKY